MSAEIDSIISSAITSIDSGGDNGATADDSGDTGTSSADDVPAADAADAGADAGAEGEGEGDPTGQPADASAGSVGDVPERTAEDIAFDAELAELGLSAPKPGQRDNRIPYSRTVKIIKNAKTKWSEKLKAEHTTELSARDQQIKDFNDLKATYDRAEQAIQSNGDGYIEFLARTYPAQYGKYVKGAAAPAAGAEKPQKPGPDLKYDDGTVGYSPEQWDRREEFTRQEAVRQAREEVTKEFNERFGPIERQYKDAQKNHEDVQRVRGDIGKLREQWGADLIDHPEVQKAIIAHMDANPKATLVAATRAVAMARISADRTKMRTELIAELKGAPKAAAKGPVAPIKSDASVNESYDDIITRAARSIR